MAKVTTSGNKAAIVQGEGTLKLEGGSLELTRSPGEGVSAMSSLIVSFGSLLGIGELDITNTLTWSGSGAMLGTGKTVLLTGATGSISGGGSLETRTFVNEGTLTIGSSYMSMAATAKFENKGTLLVNSEPAEGAIRKPLKAMPLIVNHGLIKKSAGTGESVIRVTIENFGTINAATGKFLFEAGETLKLEPSSVLEGFIRIQGPPAVGKNFSATGTLEIGSPTSLEIPSGYVGHVANFRLNGVLKGAGDLEVNSSLWVGPTWVMSGTGTTIVTAGASGEIHSMWLEERTLINEGTITASPKTLNMGYGAKIENRGTFNANVEAEFDIHKIGGAAPNFINTGLFQKTAGVGTTEVDVPFVNYGTIREVTGHLLFTNPTNVSSTYQFGKRSHCADPVDCATGDFTEHQTDLAVGGRGVGLDLTRSYSARSAAVAAAPGAFGYGWFNSFGDRLVSEESGKKITLIRSDGSSVPFIGGPGTFSSPAWSQESLNGTAEGGYTLTLADQTKYEFTGAGKPESITDRNGNKSMMAYDESGRLKEVTDPSGRKLMLAYNAEGLVKSVEDPMGHAVSYTYESKNLKTMTMPGAGSPRWQFKYDGSHRITEMIDGRGGKTTNKYDGSSRVTSQTDPAGRTIKFEYSSFHTKVINEATGAVTDQWFTTNNQPFSITHGYGTAAATTQTFTYDTGGRLLSAVDGNGHKTTYAYDPEGNLASERDAEGNETKWVYNGTHQLVSMTTPGGETTTIKRDANGNPETISRPGPEETTQMTAFEFDEYGQLESVTDPLEGTWTYGYNGQGDRTSEIDPLGSTRALGHDKDSRLTSIVTPRGNVEGAEAAEFTTTIERDLLGRPVKVIDPLGGKVEYAHDANGNLEAKTDPNGHTTKYTYNADNEQTKIEKPNGAVLETGYDGAGNITSQTDANEETTTYVRNVLGQPVEVIDPLGRKTISEFDAAGNLETMIDPFERETSYAYDMADRLIGIDYPEGAMPDADFEYDADGNVTTMVDGTGESTFVYDEFGRLSEAEDGHGDVVDYGYDLAEQLTGIIYPNGKGISRTFDKAGRLESVTDWLGGTTTFAYDPDADLKAVVFPITSGNVDEYTYDQADRMSTAKFVSGPETLGSVSYLRDKAGQVEEESGAGLPGPESPAYGYDQNERLIEAGEASFEYDPADNLTKAPGTTNLYDAASQLEAATGISYTYDKLGERIQATPEVGPATSYEYDQAGNLTSIERPEEGEVPAIGESFAYDATGLLASGTSGLTTRYLAWDNSGPLPLLLSDGENSYIYGPNGLPVEQVSAEEEPSYLHHDQLGSTRLLTDSAGEETGAFSYGPFGTLEASTGTATTSMGFAGQYTDQQSGLQYLRARFYDPATGQFLTKDPLAAVTRAPYGYANENPLRYVDPSGLCGVSVGHWGPVEYPSLDVGDCPEGVLESPWTAPVATTGGCIVAPEICFPGIVIAGGLLGTGTNLLRSENEPCFDFWRNELESVLVIIAGSAPGGVFQVTAGRTGGTKGLSALAERALHLALDAPGMLLDGAHALATP